MIHVRPARSALMLLAFCLIGLAWAPLARSATPEESGLKIALEARERAEGFGNFTARQSMVLRDKHRADFCFVSGGV